MSAEELVADWICPMCQRQLRPTSKNWGYGSFLS